MKGLESICCTRCGTGIYGGPDSGRAAQSYYCSGCAEELGMRRMSDNMCYMCDRSLSRGEIKFVMPSRGIGPYRSQAVNRLLCAACHSRLASKSRSRIRAFAAARAGARARLKSISHSMAMKNLQL